MSYFNTCRFCKKTGNDLLKYGTRAYAHHRCYLDAGKDLAGLNMWQLKRFPYFLLKERGLVERVLMLLRIYWLAAYRRGDQWAVEEKHLWEEDKAAIAKAEGTP